MSPAPDSRDGTPSLLAAARAGEAWAWQELFDTLAPAVGGYLRVQGARDVDDLVSDVFMGVVRGIGSFEGSMEQFRSWVFVIAHHRLIDERRRQARQSVVTYDGLRLGLGQLPEDVPAADAASDAFDQMGAERVVELCRRLVPDQRDVLLLRLVGDLTIEQIAEIVDKSIGAVKALQRRGLAALQKILVQEGVPL